MDEPNPYEPPRSIEEESHRASDTNERPVMLIHVAWLAVCVLNLPTPLSIAWGMTETNGRIGMCFAVVVLAAAGYWVCAKIRSVGICLIIGGIPLAISQMLPIAQLFAGGVAMVFCQVLGLVEPVGDDGRNDAVASEAAGFVLTVITGGILMTLSAGCGLLLQRFIPDPWRPAVDSDET